VPSQSLEKDHGESDRRIEFLIEKYRELLNDAKLVATTNSTDEQSESELSNDNGELQDTCILTSVRLYNISLDFQDKVITSFGFIFLKIV